MTPCGCKQRAAKVEAATGIPAEVQHVVVISALVLGTLAGLAWWAL